MMLFATCSRTFLMIGRVEDCALCGRLGDRLAGVPVQFGLGVEALEMADPAAHHQPDDPFRTGRDVAASAGCTPPSARAALFIREASRPRLRPTNPMPMSDRKRRDEKFSGQQESCEGMAIAHRIETKSLWFKSTWTSAARALTWAGWLRFAVSVRKPLRSRSSARAHSACSPTVGARPSNRSKAETTNADRAVAVSLSPTSLSIAAAISVARVSDHRRY